MAQAARRRLAARPQHELRANMFLVFGKHIEDICDKSQKTDKEAQKQKIWIIVELPCRHRKPRW